MTQSKKLLKKTDSFRRKTTRKLIGILGFFGRRNKADFIETESIKRVLICRPNHRLGNQLLITPLVQEVADTFPNTTIDLFLKGNLGEIIFENHPSIDRLIMLPKKHFKQLFTYIISWFRLRNRKYDLAINVDLGSSSGKFAAQISNAKYRLIEEEIPDQKYLPADYKHLAKKPIYQLRLYLQKLGIQNSKMEIPSLHINLKREEKDNGKNILNCIIQNDKPTIGIYTYATSNKCYAPEIWIPFYEALKMKYGNAYNIVEVLPIENISQINFMVPHFYSKDIRELAAVINAMKIFISADCGMMHLASASKTPVIGLFKFKNLKKYQPYANKSVGIHTQDLNPETIFKEIENIIFHEHNID